MWGLFFIVVVAGMVIGSDFFWEIVTAAALLGIPCALIQGQFATALFAAGLFAACAWRWSRVDG